MNINKEEFLKDKKLYIVLEQAPLKLGKIGKEFQLLDSENHRTHIEKKLKDDYSKYRPDILHQCLLTLFDSPINKAGCLKVFITTFDNVCIEIDPECRIPRTYKRFSNLFAQLLKNLKIRASNCSKTLLKVIKSPITQHLPLNILKIGTSTQAKLVNLRKYVFDTDIKINKEICYVVGAVSKGNPGMENNYVDDSICISRYSLSASNCIFKIMETYEQFWEIE